MVKFASTNQKHYPDLRSDASSVWIFCARFSDVVSQENRWCVVKCGLFSKATPKGVMSQGYYFFRSILYWSHYVVPLPVHKMQWRIQGRGLGGPPHPSEGLDPLCYPLNPPSCDYLSRHVPKILKLATWFVSLPKPKDFVAKWRPSKNFNLEGCRWKDFSQWITLSNVWTPGVWTNIFGISLMWKLIVLFKR